MPNLISSSLGDWLCVDPLDTLAFCIAWTSDLLDHIRRRRLPTPSEVGAGLCDSPHFSRYATVELDLFSFYVSGLAATGLPYSCLSSSTFSFYLVA